MEDLFSKRELIYTIYRERSFSAAAQKLFISQPALSLTVKKLEEALGTPLFDRSTKPIGLTEAGQEYIAAVEAIAHVESGFENYLRSLRGMEAGSLGIGSNQLLSSLVLPRYVASFTRQYPGIRLKLVDANSTTLENLIQGGQLDIIIDNHILPPAQFENRKLTTEQLFLAVPGSFPENSRALPCKLTCRDIVSGHFREEHCQPVDLRLFSQTPFILMNQDNDTRRQSDALFQEAGFTPRVLFEMDRLATLFSYIEEGTAASLVSDTLIRGLRPQGDICFYPLSGSHAQREIYVSYKRNRHYSQAMSVFIERLGDLSVPADGR